MDISRLLGPQSSPSESSVSRSSSPTSQTTIAGPVGGNPRELWYSSRTGSTDTVAQVQPIQQLNFAPHTAGNLSSLRSLQHETTPYAYTGESGSTRGPPGESPPLRSSSTVGKRIASAASHAREPPARKSIKWTAEENALLVSLRGARMKWEDISARIPNRSVLSCRLHYQNFLERKAEWDEDKKTKLSRLYERCAAANTGQTCKLTRSQTEGGNVGGDRQKYADALESCGSPALGTRS